MRIRTLLLTVLLCGTMVAQVPQAFDFQGVARDASGNVLNGQPIGIRLSVHGGAPVGPVVYQEVHTVSTNSFGLFSVAVGQGVPVQGAFASVAWGASSHFLQVELDASGGSSFVDMGTSQLLSVPYALHAGSVACPTVSLLGDTVRYGNGCFLIYPGMSAANGGCLDLDNDGFYDRVGCDPVDCDDNDATSFPGATEICGDGKDNDCDGEADNNPDAQAHITWYIDADGDGFGSAMSSSTACAQPVGFVINDQDCDDADPARFPGQGCSAVCSSVEQDWIDQNMEVYLNTVIGIWANCFGNGASCILDQLSAYEQSGDIPLSAECHSCALAHVDCVFSSCFPECVGDPNSAACLSCLSTSCRPAFLACVGLIDADGDGWSSGSDCDDTDATIHPGATETCDGVDNDCDGAIDDADPEVSGNFTFYRDADGDGYGDANNSVTRCTNVAPTGYVEHTGFLFDCNDQEPTVYPGAPEICDPWDNDCNGLINEEGALGQMPWFFDEDGDGFGDAGNSIMACDPPAGYVANAQDCDDLRSDVSPAALEDCFDGIDNDCDGLVDEVQNIWFQDLDGDGFGNDAVSETACTPSVGYIQTGGDCDDTDPDVHPNAGETCGDGVDNDCDGFVDEDCVPDLCDGIDNDGDGLIDEDHVQEPCGCGGFTACVNGQVECVGSQVPTAEVCDGIDNDCDGQIDEDGVCATELCDGLDNDGDGMVDEGFGLSEACGCGGVVICAGDGGTTCSVPVVPEICGNGIDDDCNGLIDEGCSGFDCGFFNGTQQGTCGGSFICVNGFCVECTDNDGDGFTTCNGDCDDNDPSISPNATEVCDGLDNNCDGTVDEGACACPPAGTPCDDGRSCTVGETEDGACNCGGGQYAPVGTACDDNNPNTSNDFCNGTGMCVGTP